MITTALLTAFFNVISLLTQFIPDVSALPYGIDSLLISASGDFRALMVDIPYLVSIWNVITFVIYVEFLLFSWWFIKWFIERIH